MDRELDRIADVLLEGSATLTISTNEDGRFFAVMRTPEKQVTSDPDLFTLEAALISLTTSIEDANL